MTPLDSVRALSEDIGPRGSATEEEAKAADYVADQLAQLGLQPERQTFLSAVSSYAPYALACGLALLSVVLFWQPQPVGAAMAAILTGTVLVALVLEMQFRSNALRWVLPIERSQNVFARIPCAAELSGGGSDEDVPIGSVAPAPGHSSKTAVITAHIDTHRTPLVFSSPAWLNVFRWSLPIGLGAIAALFALFAVGIFAPARELRWISLAPGIAVLLVFVLMVQADRTPFTKGANDNASGVAASLWLAERLAAEPLKDTRVIVVFTGCEEVGCYGADAFFDQHAGELKGAFHLTVDQVGAAGADPTVVRSERFLASANSDPRLVTMAEQLISQHPEWDARLVSANTAYGELSVGVKHGLRAIAFGAVRPDGTSPHWHQPDDVIANVDEAVLSRSQELVLALLREIDRI